MSLLPSIERDYRIAYQKWLISNKVLLKAVDKVSILQCRGEYACSLIIASPIFQSCDRTNFQNSSPN